jgi:hypothetical protein
MSKKISDIIFTRNRPLQLEAYLESLYRHISPEILKSYLIYKVERFDEQYSEVFDKFPDVKVVRESDFHDDFLTVLDSIDTPYVLFATDDVVYFDSVDFRIIDEAFNRHKDIFGFTLKFGPVYFENLPEAVQKLRAAGQDIYRVNWKKAKDRHARYPFELNSTIYRTKFVKYVLSHISHERKILKKIFRPDSLRVRFLKKIVSLKSLLLETFHDPNTLEGYGYRWCRKHKRRVPNYLYFQKLCAATLQVNRVNTSVPNPIFGTDEHSVEFLNERYKQGYRLDIEAIARNKPDSLRVGREFFRLKRWGQSG